MILKWNSGHKRALNFKNRALNAWRGVRPRPPLPPSPIPPSFLRYATGLTVKLTKKNYVRKNTFFTDIYDLIDQMANRIAKIVQETVKYSSV